MHSKLLGKYLYKDYHRLFKDREYQLSASRKGWRAPAIIPGTPRLYDNFYIRRYYTIGLDEFIRNFEVQRLMCFCGFTGPACPTTTSTTSTTTTTTTSTTSSTTTTSTTVGNNIVFDATSGDFIVYDATSGDNIIYS